MALARRKLCCAAPLQAVLSSPLTTHCSISFCFSRPKINQAFSLIGRAVGVNDIPSSLRYILNYLIWYAKYCKAVPREHSSWSKNQKPCMYHFRTLGTVGELSCTAGGFSLCLVQDGERESGTASMHAQFGEGKRQFFISAPSLAPCLSWLYPTTPSSSIHSCLLNALDFGTSLHPKSSSAEKPHPRFGSGIRSIHLQELSSGRLSKNFPRGGKRITGCMLS